jgi:hypothetical protein
MTDERGRSAPRRSRGRVERPRWTDEELATARLQAIADFRRERLDEPLEEYLELFDEYQGTVEALIEQTVDLTRIEENALAILTDPKSLLAFRYLAGPPVSEDDLKVLAEADSLAPRRLRADAEMVRRLITTVLLGLDRRRFPWISPEGNREPTEAERHAAIIASTALIAMRQLETKRRNEGKTNQEEKVKTALREAGFEEVERRPVDTLADAPGPGQFCGECSFATRNADIAVGLWDRRAMPIECKVSNSALNSIKRVKNDVASKAATWRQRFGDDNVVPTAVLSGVYDLQMLIDVQTDGLVLIWAHDLGSLVRWIASTRG